jgi:hypothetical protein
MAPPFFGANCKNNSIRPQCRIVSRLNEIGRSYGVTREKILAALDKPRKLYSILMVVDPSGSQEALQVELLKMRDEGLVKFDIHKGRWSKE